MGYGEGYIYDHLIEGSFSGQNYFPEKIKEKVFYNPNIVVMKKLKKKFLK